MPEDKKIGRISSEVSPQAPEVPVAELRVEVEEQREAGAAVSRAKEASESFLAPAPLPRSSVSSSAPSALTEQKSEMLVAIERILEEELDEMYWQLPPATQKKFRAEGERTAKKLAGIIESVRINAGKILRLIWKWLARIPQVNRFFLEQAAKIKTDKIVALHKARSHRS